MIRYIGFSYIKGDKVYDREYTIKANNYQDIISDLLETEKTENITILDKKNLIRKILS